MNISELFHTAWSPVEDNPAAYVTCRKEGVKEKVEEFPLSRPHALWMGKIPKHPRLEKDIYTWPLVDTFLAYLDRNLNQHSEDKATIMFSRRLSELMNGAQDVEGTFETDEQREKILARSRKFPRLDNRLSLEIIEEMPAHQQLFGALEAAWDPRKGVDMYAALFPAGVDQLGRVLAQVRQLWEEEPEQYELQMAALVEQLCGVLEDSPVAQWSLVIARYLYVVSLLSPYLHKEFASCVPAENDEERQEKIDQVPSCAYYSLVESSVRMSELLQGRSVQGGVIRQKKYDGIIDDLKRPLQKKEGADWKLIKTALAPLCAQLQEATFDKIYIHNKQTYYHRKQQRLVARFKGAALAALFMGGVGAVGLKYWADAVTAQQHREALHHREAAQVARERFIRSDIYDYNTDLSEQRNFQEKQEVFETAVVHMTALVCERYGISADHETVIKELVTHTLKQDGMDVSNLARFVGQRVMVADIMMEQYHSMLDAVGVSITSPFEEVLPHLSRLQKEIKKRGPDQKISLDRYWTVVGRGVQPVIRKLFQYKQFRVGDPQKRSIHKTASVVAVEDGVGGNVYLSISDYMDPVLSLYDSRRAMEFEVLQDVQLYGLRVLPWPFLRELWEYNAGTIYDDPDPRTMAYEELSWQAYYNKTHIYTYQDLLSGEVYELAMITDKDRPLLMVRKKGEELFSAQRGYEFARSLRWSFNDLF